MAGWVTSLLGAACGMAGDAEPQWTVRVDVQMVSVTPKQALMLVPQLRDERTAEAAVAKLQGMIASKEATLLAWPMSSCNSGQRTATEACLELRSPSEFEPPTFPPTFGGSGPFSFSVPKRYPRLPVSDSLRGGVPINFETRNVGPTLEIEPVVSTDGKWIALSISAQNVRFPGFDRFLDGNFPGGAENHAVKPRFEVSKVISSFSATSGKPVLAGCFFMPGNEPRVELFILRATALHNPSNVIP